MDSYHIPVLLKETLDLLQIKKGDKYIDCTLGGGGHTKGILESGGVVLALDQDPEAVRNAEKNSKFEIRNSKLKVVHGNFAHLKEIATGAGFTGVAGILMDLGVSSHQLETDYRGFSFNKDAPLDMRMDFESQLATAADLVNGLRQDELIMLFEKFGEEHEAYKIAKAICRFREVKKIETTNELANIILSARHKGKGDRSHPATRVFQALRIAVNDELFSLKEALPQALGLLKLGGRLAVISFHSLEDRIVKNNMQISANNKIMRIITNKPVGPTEEEIEMNPRARSGKLRVAERI